MPVPPSETVINQPFTSITATAAAATAVTATVAAVPGVRHVTYSVIVSVSGAASGTGVTLTVNDGTNAALVIDIAVAVGVPYILSLPAGLAGTPGSALSATLSAGATGCIGKLNLGYDSF